MPFLLSVFISFFDTNGAGNLSATPAARTSFSVESQRDETKQQEAAANCRLKLAARSRHDDAVGRTVVNFRIDPISLLSVLKISPIVFVNTASKLHYHLLPLALFSSFVGLF